MATAFDTVDPPASPGLLDELRSVLVGGAWRQRLLVALGAAAVVAGVALRFYEPSALWLDETLSVNISRLPLTQIPGALAHDGSPPLYYYLLHFWMLAFGQSDAAVRALSGVASVAALPLFWLAGRRIGGRTTAWVAFFLGLSSPFAISYATDTRMYSLMVLWALLGFLAICRLFEEPSRRRRMALGGVAALALYTHYWALYLVGATGLWLLWRSWRAWHTGQPDRWPVGAALRSLIIGGLCWLPGVPLFWWQLRHTGTPWTASAAPADLVRIFGDFSGPGAWGLVLMYALFAFLVVGVLGRPAGEGSGTRQGAVVIDLRLRPDTRPLFAVVVITLVAAVVFGAVANAAFVARYTAPVLPLFLLLVAAGIATFGDRRVGRAMVAVVTVAGLLTGLAGNSQPRTEATAVAAVLNVQARPGDMVVYCPDQLGPAVSRLLTVPRVAQLTFPRAIGPQRVDWVDYKAAIARTNVGTFAQNVLSRLGPNATLWFVWRNGYPGFGSDCGELANWFNLLRPGGTTLVGQNARYYEFENLVRYPS